MNVLVIGLGSIARKHIEALRIIVPEAKIFALRHAHPNNSLKDVANIYDLDQLKEKPDFAIISNPTHKHAETIELLTNLEMSLFIEKPPVLNPKDGDKLSRIISERNIRTYVAYNLRFLPVLRFLKENMPGNLLEATVYCGSYLPEWRTESDYSKSYSAYSQQGGGVEFDLIHELDYSVWLFGKPEKVSSVKAKVSNLDISSNDFAGYTFLYPDKVVNITLNYYRKQAKRSIELIFEDEVWYVDLLQSTIKNHKEDIIFRSETGIADTYYQQMTYFIKTLKSGEPFVPAFIDSINQMKLYYE